MYKSVIIILIIIGIILLIFNFLKKFLLYHPQPANKEKYNRFYKKINGLTDEENVKQFKIKTKDNLILDAVYLKNPDKEKCIIFFHGNAGNLSMRYDMIKFLFNYASVLAFDYRSFGLSDGSSIDLSADKLLIDAETIWNYTKGLGYTANDISLVGESLGCAIVIIFTAILSGTMEKENYPHSIILNAPFYSLKSMIENMFTKIGIPFIGKFFSNIFGNEYNSAEYIKYINHQTKIIIAHSPRDEVIPYKEGLNLFNTVSEDHPFAQFINLSGTHNNFGTTDNYIYALSDLLE